LVAITLKPGEVDASTLNRPESAAAGLIAEINVVIHTTRKHTLSRGLNDSSSIRRPKPANVATHEALNAADFTPVHRVEFGDFDNPDALRLERSIFAPEISDFIGEPGITQYAQRTRFTNPLPALKDQTAIRFCARLEDPGYCRDQPARRHRSAIVRVFGAQVSRKPAIKP
jgi:hypothetical protein